MPSDNMQTYFQDNKFKSINKSTRLDALNTIIGSHVENLSHRGNPPNAWEEDKTEDSGEFVFNVIKYTRD